jgi:hypothetical protein
MQTFVYLFQAQKPQPSVYIRAVLQHYLCSENIILGSWSIRDIIDQNLTSTVLSGSALLAREYDEIEVPQDPRFSMTRKMEEFRVRAAGPYVALLSVFCQNRSRTWRTLKHTIAEWDTLQLDAEELDAQLKAFTDTKLVCDEASRFRTMPLSRWASIYKMRQMEWFIQLGFELDIYAPDELSRMYYYLRYIGVERTLHLRAIKQDIQKALDAAQNTKQIDPETMSEKISEHRRALLYCDYHIFEAGCTAGFAGVLFRLYTALSRLGQIVQTSPPYSEAKQRHEVRMKPFLSITQPKPLTFELLKVGADQPGMSLLGLLKEASICGTDTKIDHANLSKLNQVHTFSAGSHDRWVKDIKDRLKGVIMTNLAIVKVKEAVEAVGEELLPFLISNDADGKGILPFEVKIPKSGKRIHDFWIVPELTPLSRKAKATPVAEGDH